jgi:hypothetical protein
MKGMPLAKPKLKNLQQNKKMTPCIWGHCKFNLLKIEIRTEDKN